MLGKGFILTPEQAQELLDQNPRNKDVLFPYLNGEDLNSRPDCSASRWVINFHDWSEERARSYPEVFDIVERLVKPVRMSNNRKVYRDYWWQYAEKRPAMLAAIEELDRVLVVALVSRTMMPTWTSSRQVLAHKLCIFAVDGDEYLAFLASSFHTNWAWRNSSTMKADLNYSPSDAYETLPQPSFNRALGEQGAALHRLRKDLALERNEGLTKLYSAFHDPAVTDAGIRALRELHELIDRAVADLYGWHDLDVQHDFHETKQGVRRTLGSAIKAEIFDRLLELNQERHRTE
ncbi:type IIL restriction-modification enzyme MmeI [Streptomyces ardesiacus]|uniref:type IIL restriction-modification enzyme MmeI n=1 Tax=Streptomyces ardesiacus TaxID=285564 RepID=UPI0036541944